MLHFGRKYDIKRLHHEAVYCLTVEFPPTLRKWTNQAFNDVIDDGETIKGMFEILYLAYEHSIISILPALYLRICLTYDAVSRVVLFGSHIYLSSCIIVSKKSSSTFNVLKKKCLSMTDC